MTFRDIELKSDSITKDDEGRVYIEAYAAVFGNIDSYSDVIEKGAFQKSISDKSASRIRFCYQHNMADVRGKIIEITEDDYGLKIKAMLSRTQAGKDLAIQLIDGELNELSIGYRTKQSDIIRGIRHLKEVELMECSIVSRAANDKARILSVERKNEIVSQLDQLDDNDLTALRSAVEREFAHRIIQNIKPNF